jgi:hypothetical protein
MFPPNDPPITPTHIGIPLTLPSSQPPAWPPAEDWVAWDLPRDYAPLRAMPHLTRLVLHIVEDLDANMANLMSLTQVRLHCTGRTHAPALGVSRTKGR